MIRGPRLAPLMALLVLGGCPMRTPERLLVLGGVHALDGTEPCQLVKVEPPGALEDLRWKQALVVRAHAEGRAELACGAARASLRVVRAERLRLVLVDERVVVGARFQVRAVPEAAAGQPLEIGKWTELAWQASDGVAPASDASAAEFGVAGGAFGVQAFQAARPGAATIEARLGEARGTLTITALP